MFWLNKRHSIQGKNVFHLMSQIKKAGFQPEARFVFYVLKF